MHWLIRVPEALGISPFPSIERVRSTSQSWWLIGQIKIEFNLSFQKKGTACIDGRASLLQRSRSNWGWLLRGWRCGRELPLEAVDSYRSGTLRWWIWSPGLLLCLPDERAKDDSSRSFAANHLLARILFIVSVLGKRGSFVGTQNDEHKKQWLSTKTWYYLEQKKRMFFWARFS